MLKNIEMSSNWTNLEQVRILNRVRLIALVGQSLLILFAIVYLDIKFPVVWIVGILSLEILLQSYCLIIARQDQPVSSFRLFSFIALDSMILASLVYFTGGANNPFIYLLLLFVALASFMLKPRYLVLISILSLVLYSLLNLYQRPLELGDASPLASFHLHLAGMWVNFILTVVLIAFFGLLTRYAMLKQEKQIQLMREKQLQDEQILGLGIMAASAAHELGTPLSTMAIIVEDLKYQSISKEVEDDMLMLSKQISACKTIIGSLSDKSKHAKAQLTIQQDGLYTKETDLKTQLESVVENWLVYRPNVQLVQSWQSDLASKQINLSISVEQAITNLLDNAADASIENQQNKIELIISETETEAIIEILDFGKGILPEKQQSLGLQIQETHKSNGLGWGMFLSNVSIERIGGNIQLCKSNIGGTLTRIILPEGNVSEI